MQGVIARSEAKQEGNGSQWTVLGWKKGAFVWVPFPDWGVSKATPLFGSGLGIPPKVLDLKPRETWQGSLVE